MRYLIFIVLLVTVLITSGCVSENKNSLVTSTQTPTPTVTALGTTIPLTTTISTPTQDYKTADIVVIPNKKPAYRFKMDYPSDWTYFELNPENMKAGYRFMQIGDRVLWPKFAVQVNFDDRSGSADYYEPLYIWANKTIESMKVTSFLVSNDPIIIPGTFEARKLVFKSPGNIPNTIYIMYSGQMQGYNWTVPFHREVAVKVDGPVWDYGIGGQAYQIEFYSLPDQMNTSSSIFDHMINSFEVTTKL